MTPVRSVLQCKNAFHDAYDKVKYNTFYQDNILVYHNVDDQVTDRVWFLVWELLWMKVNETP